MTRLSNVMRAACRPEIACSALKVSLVVGVVLNLVNQWGAVLGGGPADWGAGC